MGCFVASVLAVCGVVKMTYPDKPSVPKSYPDGLEAELGGPRAVRVSAALNWLIDVTDNHRRGLMASLSTGGIRAFGEKCIYVSECSYQHFITSRNLLAVHLPSFFAFILVTFQPTFRHHQCMCSYGQASLTSCNVHHLVVAYASLIISAFMILL